MLPLRILVALVMVSAVLAHSGVYSVNTTKVTKDFSAAWLVSRSRFVESEPSIKVAVSMASATFCTIRYRCKNCKTLVTRDFMDFMVEHLSSATNQLPVVDNELMSYTIHRIEQTAELLRQSPRIEKDPRLEQTVGILVFSSISFSKVDSPIQTTVRPAFFTATFWSLYRYVKNIVIYVANDKDKKIVDSMNLPYAVLTHLETPLDKKNRTSLLPRDSMLDLLYNLKSGDSFYKQYNYVFFSEGDQIVHLREPEVLFDTIDNSGGSFLVVPHRMQSLTLAKDFPEELRHKWKVNHAQNIPHMPVVVGDIDGLQGSCCQNGDISLVPCYGWWYQCTTYGIRDFPQWLKFGEYGLTMPPVTEHKATCEYFPERRQCPIPASCSSAIPRIATGKSVLTPDELCTEIVNTRYLGPPAEPIVKSGEPIVPTVDNGKEKVVTAAQLMQPLQQNLRRGHPEAMIEIHAPVPEKVVTAVAEMGDFNSGSRTIIDPMRARRSRGNKRRIRQG